MAAHVWLKRLKIPVNIGNGEALVKRFRGNTEAEEQFIEEQFIAD